MKKRNIIAMMLAAVTFMFAGCSTPEDPQVPEDEPDAISVAPEEEIFTSKGGTVEVIVTSTGEWTLSGEFDWVTPSATSGDDGDIVKFTVKANETDADKTGVFTFKAGTATADFRVVSKKQPPIGVVDEIYVAPEKEIVEKKGGSVSVVVTSTGEWTLSGGASWATPSATSGDDGDVITFTVDPNETTDDKETTFTFTRGEATADFTIVSKGGILLFLELTSEANVTIPQAGSQTDVLLNTNIEYRQIEYSIPEADQEWLEFVVRLEAENGAKMVFKVNPNATYEDRTSVITITGGENLEVKVNITQNKTVRLETDETLFTLEKNGGTIEIPVLANVEYEVKINEACTDWISYDGKTDGKEKFTIDPCTTSRQGEITFEYEDIKLTVKVTQKGDPLITTAATMTSNRAWPLWHDATPVTNMETFTFEALVYAPTFTFSAGKSNLSTIMGIEGKFLLRCGDDGIGNNQVQVVYPGEGTDRWGNPNEGKLTNTNMQLQAGKWHHVAVTYDVPNKSVKCYIDGVEKGSATANLPAVNFGIEHNNETGTKVTRCFWVGYAYEASRYWPGMMSELRIWNKVLTADEINAPNHFYSVATNSEGLVSYWKMNDDSTTGTADAIKDHTTYGNHLTTGSQITWSKVELPVFDE